MACDSLGALDVLMVLAPSTITVEAVVSPGARTLSGKWAMNVEVAVRPVGDEEGASITAAVTLSASETHAQSVGLVSRLKRLGQAAARTLISGNRNF